MAYTFKVIIAGGREFSDYNLLCEKCDYYLQERMKDGQVIIVSGHASGADSLGERYDNLKLHFKDSLPCFTFG